MQTPDIATVTAIKTASTDLLAAWTAAKAYTAKTTAKTKTANALKASTAQAALLTAARAIVLQPVTPSVPTPTPVPAPANSVVVMDIAGLNKATKTAPAGQTILLAAGTYSGLEAWAAFPNLTLASMDPAHPAILTGFYMDGASGLAFTNLVFSTAGSSDPYPFRINNCSNITFTNLDVRGDLAGNVWEQMAGLYLNSSSHITIKACELHHLSKGIVQGGCTDLLIDGNFLHDLNVDAIDGAASSHVTISNNHITDLFSGPGDHPDAIQFWTKNTTVPSTDITIAGNLIERGAGGIMQGVFLGNEDNIRYQRVAITDNTIVGGMFNGLGVSGADGVLISSNKVLELADQASWIVLRGGIANATVSNNQASAFSYADGAAPVESGNVITTAPADKGAAAIAAWKAAHSTFAPGIAK